MIMQHSLLLSTTVLNDKSVITKAQEYEVGSKLKI